MRWIVPIIFMVLIFSGCIAKSKLDGALDECSKLDASQGELCKTDIIESSGEFDRCSEIKNESYQDACRDSIAMVGNATLCEKTSCPDSCYSDAATYKKDPSLCERVSAGSNRGACYYFVWSNVGGAYELSGLNPVIPRIDPEICKRIGNETEMYTTGCYLGGETQIIWEGNVSAREKCEIETKQNSEDCSTYTDNDTRSDCLFYVALRRGDCSIIDGLFETGGAEESQCLREEAIKKDDLSICSKISQIDKNSGMPFDERGWCYYYFAVKTMNESLCDLARPNSFSCSIQVETETAVKQGNFSICDADGIQFYAAECRAAVVLNSTFGSGG